MSGELIDDGAIPEGEYELAYVDYRTQVAWGVPRVVVRFVVAQHGKHYGHELERWYRVARLKKKAKKFGDFTVGTRSALYREYVGLFGGARPDRISFSALKDKLVIGKVRTVKLDQRQRPLPEEAQYSTIDELVKLA
ncbi:MAG: hypothetical protein ACFHXK_12305 [bacterium]